MYRYAGHGATRGGQRRAGRVACWACAAPRWVPGRRGGVRTRAPPHRPPVAGGGVGLARRGRGVTGERDAGAPGAPGRGGGGQRAARARAAGRSCAQALAASPRAARSLTREVRAQV
jgi:hypothetical protein